MVFFSRRRDGGQNGRSASSVFSILPGLGCFVPWQMSNQDREAQRMQNSGSSLRYPPRRLFCRRPDCGIYHAYFAMPRPHCALFSDSPVRVNGDKTMLQDLFDIWQVLSGKLEQLPDPFHNTAPWYDVAYRFPHVWKALVRLYMSRCVDMDRSATERDPSDVGQQQLDEIYMFRCEECLRAFATFGGLTAHQAHMHGRVDWTRRFVGSTSCPVCHGEYWTRLRVRLHLKHSRRCQTMIEYGAVPNNVAAGRHLHFAARPPLPGFLVARL